jgi:cytochrome c biogenesis protein CcmG/thiol:disulfide interchange protein DsbE
MPRRPAVLAAAPALAVALAAAALLAGCPAAAPRGAARTTDVGSVDTALAPCPAPSGRPAHGDRTMPDLTLDCLGGGRLALGEAPGVPTLVNLWGSWCGPCREELPLLQRFADTARERVRVVGVISKDGVPQADSFAADAGVTFPGAFDGEGRLMSELGVNALPYTYFLTPDGAVAYTQVGPVRSEDELRALVAEHLGVRL